MQQCTHIHGETPRENASILQCCSCKITNLCECNCLPSLATWSCKILSGCEHNSFPLLLLLPLPPLLSPSSSVVLLSPPFPPPCPLPPPQVQSLNPSTHLHPSPSPHPLSGNHPGFHHTPTVQHPTSSLLPQPHTSTTNLPPNVTSGNPSLLNVPLYGITPLPTPGTTPTQAPQQNMGILEANHSGIIPTPLTGINPSGPPGLTPNNSGVVSSVHNPGVAGGGLACSSVLGRPGVGQRMPGPHVAAARATNVSQQAGLLPLPSSLLQGQSVAAAVPLALSLPSPPIRLPPNWKVAKDGAGKCYYYHAITRKTQWDPPAALDEGTITMDLGTPEHSGGEEEATVGCVHACMHVGWCVYVV